MLEKPKRQLIHDLHQSGQSLRQIGKLLDISKNTVRKVLAEGPDIIVNTKNKDDELVPLVRNVFKHCYGNVVRVQEMLKELYNIDVGYSTLTRIVRRDDIRNPSKRSGTYTYEPGMEMQHDTSPHKTIVNHKKETLQCASLVFANSRKLYIQYYKRFTRFEAKSFLKKALIFFKGSCRQCIIDNTSVILASGSGSDAVMAPEMKEFARIFGFEFKAHAIGHADRKALVERNFHYVENNFLAGREFSSLQDLNKEALKWCQDVANNKKKRSLGITPMAAGRLERPMLIPLSELLPPVYEHCKRSVDVQGYVSLETNRYSVPEKLIGKDVDVYKYEDQVEVYYNHQLMTTHERLIDERDKRITLKEHHKKMWKQRGECRRKQS